MNDANFWIEWNDGKTAKDVCHDEALERLFTKYEEATPLNKSGDQLII